MDNRTPKRKITVEYASQWMKSKGFVQHPVEGYWCYPEDMREVGLHPAMLATFVMDWETDQLGLFDKK